MPCIAGALSSNGDLNLLDSRLATVYLSDINECQHLPRHFASVAGELSSDDDFYLLDTGLAVLQTTNDILDASLYDLLTPASLTSWQRVRAANMLSTTGAPPRED